MIYRFMPESYRRKIKIMLRNAGSSRNPERFTNISFIFSLLAGVGLAIIAGNLWHLAFAMGFAGVFGLSHGLVALAVDRRARFVETILPDALLLMSANSRAGYIPSRALLLSARKEFGPLSDAIKKAGKEMMTGKSLEQSLEVIPKYIKSEVLERTVKLISWGARSGGQFAELLEQNAEDIRRKQGIKKEIRANVTMYIIFIGFAGCIGAPVLYALSSFLATTIGKLGASAQLPETVQSQVSFIQFSGIAISPDFLFFFSIVAIFLTTFFGGMIIGSITAGSNRAGIRYSPFMMIVGFLVFFIARGFIESSFGVFIP